MVRILSILFVMSFAITLLERAAIADDKPPACQDCDCVTAIAWQNIVNNRVIGDRVADFNTGIAGDPVSSADDTDVSSNTCGAPYLWTYKTVYGLYSYNIQSATLVCSGQSETWVPVNLDDSATFVYIGTQNMTDCQKTVQGQ